MITLSLAVREISWVPPNLSGSRDLTTLLSFMTAILVILRLGLATVNMRTKFEVSIFAHYEHIKRDTKWVALGQLGSLKITENSAIR